MLTKYTLKNGIPVYIVPTSAAPVVSVQAWIGRGSIYETKAVAGISHFLEHSLFKGTKRRKVGQIALEVESHGGEINAFTSFEETVYYTTLASRYFHEGLDIISDAILYPSFDPEEMRREREVILEEIKRAQDSPHRILSQNLWRTSFPGSPYGRPVLGYQETVRKIDHRTLRNYFQAHYHNQSTSLFIVGDVDPADAAKTAEKMLGKMRKGKRLEPPKVPRYDLAKKVQVVNAEKDIKECYIQVAWPAPVISHPHLAWYDLFCSSSGSGESSPLYQHLVKDTQVALDVGLGLISTARCGMVVANVQTEPEKMHEALQELSRVLPKIAQAGIEPAQLDRVKTSLESDVIGGKETVEGYARRLGYYYIQFGDPEYERKYLDQALAVTPEQASTALAQTLTHHPVVSLVHPSGFKVDSSAIAKSFTPEKKNRVTVPVPKVTLKLNCREGIRFIEKPSWSLPITAMKLILPGGSREEEESQLGISTLFQRLWTSGTKSYSSRQISHLLESLGASIYAFSGRHNFGLSTEFLTKHWQNLKPVFEEILLCPSFPEDEFQIEKAHLLQDLKSERDNPGSLCQMGFLSALYGDHPYGRSSLGKKEAVERLTVADLQKFYRDHIHQGTVVVSTVGQFEATSWEEEIFQMVSKLPAKGKPLSPKKEVAPIEKTRIVFEKKQPLFQSHILVGFLAASHGDPDRIALKLISSCLSGQGGRLFLELRDKQSLAYTVAPITSENPERGIFGVYIACSPEKVETALRGIRLELDKVVQKPLGAKELARAKEYWIGRFELEMQRYSGQAMMYGLDEIYGQGFDYSRKLPELIKNTTGRDLQKAAAKYLTTTKPVISIVHNDDLSDEKILKAWNG